MKGTTYIVLPAFNEGEMIGRVVAELVPLYPHVVVVDDGSSDGTAQAARRAGATVLSHVINRGQGAALQTGIAYALAAGAEYLVTFDSDGQHAPEDVAVLLAPLAEGRAEVALGSRFLGEAPGMPRSRRLMLKGAVWFTRLVSRVTVTDAHNGLRAFTRRAAAALAITADRMAHASQLLDQVRSSGCRYTEVPVRIRYTDYSRAKGQSSLSALTVALDYLLVRWLR